MNYVSTWLVLAKGDHRLRECDAVRRFAGPVLGERVLGEWRELRIADTGEGDADAPALIRATRAPVLVLYVIDEACAIGEGLPASGDGFDVVFGLEHLTRHYGAALPEDYSAAAAVEGLCAWAAEVGLVAESGAVERALAGRGVHALYEAMGFAFVPHGL
jgi:hypothetical protein